MRKSSAANREASSPPAPARISMMAGLSSLGSLGVNNSASLLLMIPSSVSRSVLRDSSSGSALEVSISA